MAGNVSWYEDYLDSETPDCSLCHNLTIKHCHHTGQYLPTARGYGNTERKVRKGTNGPGLTLRPSVAQWEI